MGTALRILGIDPGLERTGYGLIEYSEGDHQQYRLRAHGVFSLSRNLPLQERLSSLYEQLASFLKLYQPSVMVLEELYSHYEHPTTAILMGHARGVVCLAAAQYEILVIGYGATRVKKAVTGNGLASKEQIHRMVCHLLGLADLSGPHDVTDALALAIAHADISRKGLESQQRITLPRGTHPVGGSPSHQGRGERWREEQGSGEMERVR